MRARQLPAFLEKETYDPNRYDLLVVLEGTEGDAFYRSAGLARLIGDFNGRPVMAAAAVIQALPKKQRGLLTALPPARPGAHRYQLVSRQLSEVVERSFAIATIIQPVPRLVYDAILCIEPDFDEQVFWGIKAILESEGLNVLVASAEPGTVRSMNGAFAHASVAYVQALQMASPAPLIVAAGGLWTDHKPLPARVALHIDWLNLQWSRGRQMVVFGLASYHLCNQSAFKGLEVSSSDQTLWSFQKQGATYSNAAVTQTAPNLITVKSACYVGQAAVRMRQAGFLRQTEK